jgi:hypothetical protein
MAKSNAVEFKGIIRKATGMDAYFIPVEFDVEKEFGKKRLKAKIWYDKILYRGLLAKYNGSYNLMINKATREKLGKLPGQAVNVMIEEDTDARIAEIPAALEAFFQKEKGLRKYFDTLSYTHQKEYAEWIRSAKRFQTLESRLIKLKELLSAKLKK